jgi:hypothetical protein
VKEKSPKVCSAEKQCFDVLINTKLSETNVKQGLHHKV